MTMLPVRESVLGVGVSATSYGEVLRLIRDWVAERRKWLTESTPSVPPPPGRAIFAVCVHNCISAVMDPELMKVINSADLATPDGMPLVWALRSFGAHGQGRVYGPDVMLAACGQAAREQHRVFLFGGSESSLPRLQSRLQARFPALRICGSISPPFRPFTDQENDEFISEIVASGADVVFVGIGAPKQERWIMEHRDRMQGAVLLGVGAAFNFHAGTVKQAPQRMQRAGLEWLFRLAMEPRRLWRRYLVTNPIFLAMWAFQWVERRLAGLSQERRSHFRM